MRLRERAFMPEVEARHGGAPLSAEGIRMTRTPSCQADMSIVALKSEAYPLPPPAPLPSLTSAFSRRAALFGAVTATGFLGAAGTAALGQGYTAQHTPSALDPADARLVALSADPIVDMYRRAKALRAVHDHPDTSVPDADAAYDEISELRAEAFELGATTPAGALAALEWARDEFAEYYVETSKDPDWLDRFTLRLIDNAIAVLRAEVSNG